MRYWADRQIFLKDAGLDTLRRITLSDLEAAQATFGLLMGNDVAFRKESITTAAATLDRSRIDI